MSASSLRSILRDGPRRIKSPALRTPAVQRSPRARPRRATAFGRRWPRRRRARGRELQIKRWTRKKKEALISGNMEGLKSMGNKRVS